MSEKLNPQKALIFRIVHRDNVPWIFSHGMHCRNSSVQDPNYRTIGNLELIDRRQYRVVPIHPGGTLSDYIPFYFTPYSPMMYKIKTGHGGIPRVPNEEIVIFVSSVHTLESKGLQFTFSDRHAYLQTAMFYNHTSHLDEIDWKLLQKKDFKRDPDDPGKVERYQAEALVHRYIPVTAFIGVVCYTDKIRELLQDLANRTEVNLKVVKEPRWYF